MVVGYLCNVGKRIKAIRVDRKETLEQFAENIRMQTDGVVKTTKSNVSKWEKGLNLPNDITIKAIADLGNVTVDYLMGVDDTSKDMISIPISEYKRLKEVESQLNSIKEILGGI